MRKAKRQKGGEVEEAKTERRYKGRKTKRERGKKEKKEEMEKGRSGRVIFYIAWSARGTTTNTIHITFYIIISHVTIDMMMMLMMIIIIILIVIIISIEY